MLFIQNKFGSRLVGNSSRYGINEKVALEAIWNFGIVRLWRYKIFVKKLKVHFLHFSGTRSLEEDCRTLIQFRGCEIEKILFFLTIRQCSSALVKIS